ncbi:hypothetical protein JIG36_30960 [Actinoplanes sp. LDG1-06]|uniref:Uncharacterized protein n=1 Tax=Paractinoplanes ovalisporus TaxID=2810368 RepID=A0ABS2AJD7_9ACTN|nr:hypothetical protein [Actinoplanes ovalisporus]MBM2619942.1 hypothetical protein [Actinoplanes ovalisporus]
MTNTAQKLAAGWAALYGTLALVWTVTGRGFPYGPGADGSETSPLRAVTPEAGAPVFAGVLLVTAVLLLIMSGGRTIKGLLRYGILAYLAVVAITLLVVLPDTHLLTLAGYAPMLIIGLPFGWPPVDWSTVFTWTLANQAFAVVGGLLIARAALRWQFGTAGACEDCGRDDRPGGWTSRQSAALWGRRAAYVAALIPVLYALTRFAWVLGVPLGLPSDALDELRNSGAVWAGLGLGAFAVVGAILTLGLVQRWGEVFPRWTAGLAGQRVPIRLATVPATLVSIFVMSASVAFYADPVFFDKLTTDTMAVAPMLAWPVWSVALGAATLAYHLRRRPACAKCGRSDSPAGVVSQQQAGAY